MTVRGTADVRVHGWLHGRLLGRLLAVLLLALALGTAPVTQPSVVQPSVARPWSQGFTGPAASWAGGVVGVGHEHPSAVAVGHTPWRQAGRDLPGGAGAAVAAAVWVGVVLVGGGIAASHGVRLRARRTAPARGRGPPAPGTPSS